MLIAIMLNTLSLWIIDFRLTISHNMYVLVSFTLGKIKFSSHIESVIRVDKVYYEVLN